MAAPPLPRPAATGVLPDGSVRTGVLQEMLARVLERDISRQEILHLKIRRKRARLGARQGAVVRIGPSGGEGARGTGLWSFGDLVRLASILAVAPSPPGLRARIWNSLPDSHLQERVADLHGQISGLERDGVRLAKLARVGSSPHRSLAEELLFLLPGLARRYLILPLSTTRSVEGTVAWPTCPPAAAGVWVDLTGILLRALLEWDSLLPGRAGPGVGSRTIS